MSNENQEQQGVWADFDAAYKKACETSDPKNYQHAALIAQQVRMKVRAATQPPPTPASVPVVEREDLEEEIERLQTALTDLADRSVYRGNSVSFIYDKAAAYKAALLRSFAVLHEFGFHADGATELCDLIRAALSSSPAPVQQGVGVPEGPRPLPESMSRDEMLKYYSSYSNLCAHEALRYQKRIRDLEAALLAAAPNPQPALVHGDVVAESEEQQGWSLWVAGMVGSYLGFDVDDKRNAAIAGIIQRRIRALRPSLAATQPAPVQGEQDSAYPSDVEIEVPPIGSQWDHSNGDTYTVTGYADMFSDNHQRRQPRIIYRSTKTGRVWSREHSDWHRAMKPAIRAARSTGGQSNG